MKETPGVNSNLSHYRIAAKIGAGRMGEVYRARDPKLGRDPVKKFFRLVSPLTLNT